MTGTFEGFGHLLLPRHPYARSVAGKSSASHDDQIDSASSISLRTVRNTSSVTMQSIRSIEHIRPKPRRPNFDESASTTLLAEARIIFCVSVASSAVAQDAEIGIDAVRAEEFRQITFSNPCAHIRPAPTATSCRARLRARSPSSPPTVHQHRHAQRFWRHYIEMPDRPYPFGKGIDGRPRSDEDRIVGTNQPGRLHGDLLFDFAVDGTLDMPDILHHGLTGLALPCVR